MQVKAPSKAPAIPTAQELLDARNYLSPEEYAQLVSLINGVSLPPITLHDFVKKSWSWVEPNVPFKDNWHIGVMAEHLEAVVWGQISNLVINIPPRHMKSIMVAVCFQPWVWTFRAWTQWLFFSHSKGFSMRDTMRSRRLIMSDWYQDNFGAAFSLRDDQNTKTKYENNQGGFRSALGAGGATGDGGDFLVGDDLLNIDDRHSKAVREGVNEFWGTTVATRKNSDEAAKIIICQRLHEHDIVGYVERQEEAGGDHYEILAIPAMYEGANAFPVTAVDWKDPRTDYGDALWPERFDRASLNKLKRTLGGDSAALLQQRPSPQTGAIFKKYLWKYWVPVGSKLPPVTVKVEEDTTIRGIKYAAGDVYECETIELDRATLRDYLQSWDMAFKGTSQSAYVAGQVWARRGEAECFLLDQERGKWDFLKTIDAVHRLTKRVPEATLKLVEEKANGAAVISALKTNVQGLVPINPKGDKTSRAHAVTPLQEAGNIYLPHPLLYVWVDDYIDELTMFPNGEYMDQVDATAQALNRMQSGFWTR